MCPLVESNAQQLTCGKTPESSCKRQERTEWTASWLLAMDLGLFNIWALQSYQYDPHVDETIPQKPVHEGPLWGEHVGISLLALRFLLLGRKGRAVLTRRVLIEACRM